MSLWCWETGCLLSTTQTVSGLRPCRQTQISPPPPLPPVSCPITVTTVRGVVGWECVEQWGLHPECVRACVRACFVSLLWSGASVLVVSCSSETPMLIIVFWKCFSSALYFSDAFTQSEHNYRVVQNLHPPRVTKKAFILSEKTLRAQTTARGKDIGSNNVTAVCGSSPHCGVHLMSRWCAHKDWRVV